MQGLPKKVKITLGTLDVLLLLWTTKFVCWFYYKNAKALSSVFGKILQISTNFDKLQKQRQYKPDVAFFFFLSSKKTTLSNWLIKTNTIACPFCLDDRRPKCIDPVFLEGFLFWSSEAPCSATLHKSFLAVIRSDESEIDSLQGDWITRHTEKFSSFACGLSFGLPSREQYFFFIIKPFYLPNWINAYSTALRYLSSLILVVDVQLLRAIYSQYRFLYQP